MGAQMYSTFLHLKELLFQLESIRLTAMMEGTTRQEKYAIPLKFGNKINALCWTRGEEKKLPIGSPETGHKNQNKVQPYRR